MKWSGWFYYIDNDTNTEHLLVLHWINTKQEFPMSELINILITTDYVLVHACVNSRKHVSELTFDGRLTQFKVEGDFT